jgi:chromosomal replication initiator protein
LGEGFREAEQLERTWAKLERRLRASFPDRVYEMWLGTLEPLRLEGPTLYVEAPEHTFGWIQRRFATTLAAIAGEIDPSIERVEIQTRPTASHETPTETRAQGLQRQLAFKPTYTFDRFVIGRSNRFAHAAALAVAEMPAQAYNPLFIYGPPGVGKTHLLHAIGNYVAAHNSSLSVHYTTVEAFTNHFMSALQQNDIERFKRTYRDSDVLLLDDVEFLEGKKKTGEEFFYTFDAISSTGAQAVFSGANHPSKMPLLEPRLSERLQSGLIVDLHPPDQETRLAILRKLSSFSSTVIDSDVLDYIATEITPNTRVLEGALIRVLAFASLTESPVTVDLARQVLANLYQEAIPPNPNPSTSTAIRQIQDQTATTFELSQTDLCSARRSRSVVYARQIAMYLCRELTDLSLPTIAKHFGGRDHTTVLHAHRKIQKSMLQDAETRSIVSAISDNLSKTHN